MTARLRSLVFLAPLLGGCYEYLPARSPTNLIGQRVQLALTDSGAVVLASRLGPSVEAVEGTLLADSLGSYRVAVTVTRMRSGTEMDWRGESVAVAHGLVWSLSERRFSPSRTLFASGLATAGVVGATIGLRGRGSSSAGSETPGNKPGQ
jgi:hypothetical protein